MRILSTILVFFIVGCGVTAKVVDYTPNTSGIDNPAAIIKRVLEQQPPAYAYVPVKVDVDEQKFVLHIQESFNPWTFQYRQGTSQYVYFYKNIGKIEIAKIDKSVWCVNVNDKAENIMTQVFTMDEKDAKLFVDALSFMSSTAD